MKINFLISSLSGGGAEKVLQNLVNNMDKEKFDITVQTVWKENPEEYLNKNIKYKYIYPSYSKLNNYKYRLSVLLKIIYPLHIKDNYDIEVAYLECGATKVISTSTNKNAKKVAVIHLSFNLIGTLFFMVLYFGLHIIFDFGFVDKIEDKHRVYRRR